MRSWLPVLLLVPLGLLLMFRARPPAVFFLRPVVAPQLWAGGPKPCQSPACRGRFHAAQRALLQAMYWIRQGGDFHARPGVYCCRCFACWPPGGGDPRGRCPTARTTRGRPAIGWPVAASLNVAGGRGAGRCGRRIRRAGATDATHVTYLGDRRRSVGFYSQATGHAHPLTAADYLGYPRMACHPDRDQQHPGGGVVAGRLATTTQWNLVPMILPPPPSAGRHQTLRNRAARSTFSRISAWSA